MYARMCFTITVTRIYVYWYVTRNRKGLLYALRKLGTGTSKAVRTVRTGAQTETDLSTYIEVQSDRHNTRMRMPWQYQVSGAGLLTSQTATE